MRRPPFVFLFVVFISFTLIISCCKKDNCITCPPPGQDTTSHNWTFETFVLGDGNSSVLYDVTIINDMLANAVGEIYLKDSLGNYDQLPYNLVKWDGQSWELQKLNYAGSPPIIRTIFAINDHDMWLDPWFHWDGQKFQELPIDPILIGVGVNKIWGGSDGIYVVGNNGFIAHSSINGVWTKIDSKTDLQFLDIYGSTDSKTGVQQILAVCTRNYPPGRGIFSIRGNAATQFSSYTIQDELFGVWFVPNRHYYVVGGGIYEKNSLSDSTWENGPLDITHYATTKVRGNGLNDVIVVGAFGEFLHWNGSTWKSFIDQTGLPNGSYSSVAIRGNLVIAVGANNAKAVIAIGRR